MTVYKKMFVCLLAFVANASLAVPSYGRFPDSMKAPYSPDLLNFANNVVCYMENEEGSYDDMVFDVGYFTPDGGKMWLRPNIDEYSCQSTLRNNKNFKPDPIYKDVYRMARCLGTPDECIVYKAHYNSGR